MQITLFFENIYSFFMFLKVSLRLFSSITTCINDNRLFFFYIYIYILLSFENYRLVMFIVDILTQIFIFLIPDFFSWSFYKKFICFQFYLSISIWHIYIFYFVLFFRFLIFFLGLFVNISLVFNFIHQSKFLVYYFSQFGANSFDFFLFFLFVKIIFLFNLTLQ
jgi:hypothetical protein